MVPHQDLSDLIILLNQAKIRMALHGILRAWEVPKNLGLPLIQGFGTFDPTDHRVTRIKDALVFDMRRELVKTKPPCKSPLIGTV
jgi:hypothetical protein